MNDFRRAIIFVHFDKDNLVDDYVYYYLNVLKEHSSYLLFVTTSILLEEDKDKLSHYCSDIIIRENVGYDFMSYKTGLNSFDYTQYDELLLCNDSVYGPFYPLDEMFTTMQVKSCDFWGITDNTDISYHLQSYFLLFKKSLFTHNSFKDFWEAVVVLESKDEIIEKYEVGLTKFFVNHKFTPDSYIQFIPTFTQKIFIFMKKLTPHKVLTKVYSLLTGNYPLQRVGKINATLHFWKELILTTRMPFIKIMMLRDNPNNMNINTFEEVLSQVSDYDTDLIVKHLSRTKGKR